MSITPEVLTGLAAGILAVAFEYVPGLSGWYDALIPERKRLVMLLLLVVVALVIFGLGCGGYVGGVTCDANGLLGLLWLIGLAIGINQGVHSIGKRPAIDG